MRRQACLFLVRSVAVFVLVAPVPAAAQPGAVNGTVLDVSGAPIPGAMITAEGPGGAEVKTQTLAYVVLPSFFIDFHVPLRYMHVNLQRAVPDEDDGGGGRRFSVGVAIPTSWRLSTCHPTAVLHAATVSSRSAT